MLKGVSESLTGRYELILITHWSYAEMHEAFDFGLDDYIFFGGYPGSAAYIRDEPRWRNYVNSSLIAPSIEKDILMMTRVDKPVLLKQLFHLGCRYSGQLLSYTKMIGLELSPFDGHIKLCVKEKEDDSEIQTCIPRGI